MGRDALLADVSFAGLVVALLAVGYVQGALPIPFVPWQITEAQLAIGSFAALHGRTPADSSSAD